MPGAKTLEKVPAYIQAISWKLLMQGRSSPLDPQIAVGVVLQNQHAVALGQLIHLFPFFRLMGDTERIFES